jgi:hypothetical protein
MIGALLLALSLLLSLPGVAASQDSGFPTDDYLEGYLGPYRGRVIDTETREPIVGAVVVATWDRYRIIPMRRIREFHAARETLTDANGEFVLDARDVEENAPRRAKQPTFIIFKPGYGPFPSHHVAPKGSYGYKLFQMAETTIELRHASRSERLRGLMRVDSAALPNSWGDLLPRLYQAVNDEHIQLGLTPLPAPPGRTP